MRVKYFDFIAILLINESICFNVFIGVGDFGGGILGIQCLVLQSLGISLGSNCLFGCQEALLNDFGTVTRGRGLVVIVPHFAWTDDCLGI